MPLNLNVSIQTTNESDLIDALALILKQVREGYTSGTDRNSEGHYSYALSGEDDVETLTRQGWEEEEEPEGNGLRWQRGEHRQKTTAEALQLGAA